MTIISTFEEHLTAYPVFYRTYSRRTNDSRENWLDVCKRTTQGLAKLGRLSLAEAELIYNQQKELKALTSGRYLWVGGTDWAEKPDNFPGVYNCSSTIIDSWEAFALVMDVTMMGCGAGAVVEPRYINQLPKIINSINLRITKTIGSQTKELRQENSSLVAGQNEITIICGDSRKGWVDAYRMLLELSSDDTYGAFGHLINVNIDLSNVRPAGERLNGFGGISNPILLADTFINCASVLNKSVGRQLNSVECCLLIDISAKAIVAGNVRRSAGMKQGCQYDKTFETAKDNLWQQTPNGKWFIDPERDALRMSNHTRVFHQKPTKQECIDAVRKQYYSGEGAIQWVGEAVARANIDVIDKLGSNGKELVLDSYQKGTLKELIKEVLGEVSDKEIEHRLARYGLNPCLTADN
ncbi:MAG: ribonucleoside-triphosphate reductase, adenosylcobalamin-dependent, intein containing, partial [Cyanobacteriota bacterium]